MLFSERVGEAQRLATMVGSINKYHLNCVSFCLLFKQCMECRCIFYRKWERRILQLKPGRRDGSMMTMMITWILRSMESKKEISEKMRKLWGMISILISVVNIQQRQNVWDGCVHEAHNFDIHAFVHSLRRMNLTLTSYSLLVILVLSLHSHNNDEWTAACGGKHLSSCTCLYWWCKSWMCGQAIQIFCL